MVHVGYRWNCLGACVSVRSGQDYCKNLELEEIVLCYTVCCFDVMFNEYKGCKDAKTFCMPRMCVMLDTWYYSFALLPKFLTSCSIVHEKAPHCCTFREASLTRKLAPLAWMMYLDKYSCIVSALHWVWLQNSLTCSDSAWFIWLTSQVDGELVSILLLVVGLLGMFFVTWKPFLWGSGITGKLDSLVTGVIGMCWW